MPDALTFFGSKAQGAASAAGDLLSPVGGIDASGNYQPAKFNDVNQLKVEAGGMAAVISSFSPSALAAGTQVVGSTVDVSRSTNIAIQVTAFTSGKLCVKVSNDATNWDAVSVIHQGTGQLIGGQTDGFFISAGEDFAIPGVYRYVSLWAGDTALTATISLMVDNTPTSLMPFTGAQQLDYRNAYTATGSNNVFLPSDGTGFFDVSGFNAICVEWTATLTTGTIAFQFSNNPAVSAMWANAPWQRLGAPTTAPSFAATAASPVADKYFVPVMGRYFRVTTVVGTAVSADFRVFALGVYPTQLTPVSQPITYTQGALVASTALVGDMGIGIRATTTNSHVLATGTKHLVAAASTNATVLKASAGRLYGWSLGNTTAAWVYVKFHNAATTPTAGTGVVQTVPIPPNGMAVFKDMIGTYYGTGISITTVTGAADANTTAVGAEAIVGEFFLG